MNMNFTFNSKSNKITFRFHHKYCNSKTLLFMNYTYTTFL